ncbi:hypothetical protein ACHAQA_000964 [Verticillium albo-atrum]
MAASSPAGPSTKHGIAFPGGNPDFRAARNRCAKACAAFNALSESSAPAERVQAWLNIVDPARVHSGQPDQTHAATTSEASFTNPNARPAAPFVKPPIFVDYGLRVYVDATAFVNRGCTILDTPVADVRIGANCNIGPNVSFYSVTHPLTCQPDGKRLSAGKPITVGDRVWIGGGVIVLCGVRIGQGSVIAAGSVVTGDVPAGCVAAGVPAKVVREIGRDEEFDAAMVADLEGALGMAYHHGEGRSLSREEIAAILNAAF